MRKVRELAANTLELPPEVALSAVKIIVTGNGELKAVNHRGIIVYETSRILFQTADGPVEVSGRDLTLAEMKEEYLRIDGVILNIRLPENSHED